MHPHNLSTSQVTIRMQCMYLYVVHVAVAVLAVSRVDRNIQTTCQLTENTTRERHICGSLVSSVNRTATARAGHYVTVIVRRLLLVWLSPPGKLVYHALLWVVRILSRLVDCSNAIVDDGFAARPFVADGASSYCMRGQPSTTPAVLQHCRSSVADWNRCGVDQRAVAHERPIGPSRDLAAAGMHSTARHRRSRRDRAPDVVCKRQHSAPLSERMRSRLSRWLSFSACSC